MKLKHMDKLSAHLDRYLGAKEDECTVLHQVLDGGYHVDVFVYPPNEKFPFWKLVTVGTSDYKLPKMVAKPFSTRNEYMMFVDSEEDLTQQEVIRWYYNHLLHVATYAFREKTYVTYGHSFGWENEDPADEMIGAYLELPQVLEDFGVLRCKAGFGWTATFLQVVLLNKADVEHYMRIGPEQFSNYLYPENGRPHFLSQRHRDEKF